MFRFEVFVDDKKLTYVLWALQGHCTISTPQPVINAKRTKDGSIRARSGGNSHELFATFLTDSKMKEVTPHDVREFCRTHGLSENSYSNVLYRAQDHKLIKRIKTKGAKGNMGFKYEVLSQPTTKGE